MLIILIKSFTYLSMMLLLLYACYDYLNMVIDFVLCLFMLSYLCLAYV